MSATLDGLGVTRNLVPLVTYAALSMWTLATIIVALLVHFGSNGEHYQPWIVPMCLLNSSAAILVGRIKKTRSRS